MVVNEMINVDEELIKLKSFIKENCLPEWRDLIPTFENAYIKLVNAIRRGRGGYFYKSFALELGLIYNDDEIDGMAGNNRSDLGAILGTLSEFEVKNGRPMISAIVVSKKTGKPSKPFFNFARDLGFDFNSEEQFLKDTWKELRKTWF